MKRINESIKRETPKTEAVITPSHNERLVGKLLLTTANLSQKEVKMSSKEEGMAKAIENANVDWKNAVEKRMIYLIRNKRFFTADDVIVYLTDRNIKTHNNSALGGFFSRYANRGYISEAGFVISTRPSRHKAPIRLWKSNFYRKEIA